MDEQVFQTAERLGPWVVLVVYIIWSKWDDIKQGISKLYHDRHADSEDRREDDQDIRRVKLDFEFQKQATQQLQDYQERHAALDIIREQNRFAQKEFGELSNDVRLVKNQLTLLFGAISEIRDDIREILNAKRH